MRLSIIGFGKMGGALAKSFLRKKVVESITVFDIVDEKMSVAGKLGLDTAASELDAVKAGDAILLAVKPGDIESLAKKIGGHVKNKLVISILAGVSTSILEKLLPGARVVRVMPNINVAVEAAISAVCGGKLASEEDINFTKKLFSAVGEVVVVEEALMDAITALSGCGPAFIAMIIDGLSLAGVRMGLPKKLALRITCKVVAGTAEHVKLLESTEKLVEKVSTPAGATIEGVQLLESKGIRGILMEAVWNSYVKSSKLLRR